jgi:hypothetical protein
MEIAEALELLKEYLGELEHLRTLHHGNAERWRWKNRLNVVIEAAFGKESDEYRHLNFFIISIPMYSTEEEKQKRYLRDLDEDELGIQKILDKYAILGIKEQSPKAHKAKEKPPLGYKIPHKE